MRGVYRVKQLLSNLIKLVRCVPVLNKLLSNLIKLATAFPSDSNMLGVYQFKQNAQQLNKNNKLLRSYQTHARCEQIAKQLKKKQFLHSNPPVAVSLGDDNHRNRVTNANTQSQSYVCIKTRLMLQASIIDKLNTESLAILRSISYSVFIPQILTSGPIKESGVASPHKYGTSTIDCRQERIL